jgi:DNA repair photolyase
MTMIRGTKEWAVAEINCSTGCPHECRYCYARTKALKNNIIASAADWSRVRVIETELTREYPRFPGQVMFPASHDIVSENLDACLSVIDRLLAKGNQLLIVSKPSPDIIARLCNEFDKLKEQVLFRFTITARNPEILAFWESGAPGYQQRRESLELAEKRGFATSVSIEPMLDIDDIFGLVDDLSPFVSHSIWIGLMNRISERVAIDSETARQEVARIEAGQTDKKIKNIYGQLKNNPLLRWKESIKKIVGLPEATVPGLDL